MTHSPDGIRTELLLGGTEWEDITSSVRGSSGIQLYRGRTDERGRTRTTLGLTLEDPNGDFNDLNPLSPYYGLIGPNTQLRVTVGDGRSLEDNFNRSVTNEWNTVLYTWNVDDEGWVGEGSTSVVRVTSPDNDTSSSGSLEATKTMGSGFDSLRFNDNEGTRDISAAGDSLAVWVLVPGGSGGTGWLGHLEVQNPSFTWIAGSDVALTPGTWARLTFTDPGGLFANCRSIGVQISATGVNASQDVNIDTLIQYSSTSPLWSLEVAGTGVALADFDVNGTHATMTNASAAVHHYATTTLGQTNQRVRTTFKLSAGTITGASVTTWILGRYTDLNNYYAAVVTMTTAGVVEFELVKRVAGAVTIIDEGAEPYNGYSGLFDDNEFTVELYIEGSQIYAKIWDSTLETEASSWLLSATDTSLTTGDGVGIAARRETGNTNSNLEFRFNSFLAVPGTIRAHVEVPNFGASRWTPGGNDVTMAIQGAGIKRRLGSSGTSALQSPLYRFVTRSDQSQIVGYWPCEDGQFVSQIGSAAGSPPLNVAGSSVSFGTTSPFPGAASMVRLSSTSSLSASVLTSADTGQIRGHVLFEFPESGLGDDKQLMMIMQLKDTTVRKWYLRYQESTGGSLAIVGYDHTFSLVENTGYIAFGMNGKSALVHWQVSQNGADVDWEIATHEIQQDGTVESFANTGTFSGSSVGAPTGVAIAPAGGMDGCAVGHVVVMNNVDVLDGAEVPLTGHIQETAVNRFERLCNEEGIANEVVGGNGSNSSVRMGPQRIATLLQNLEDCEDAEHGIMYEARHFLGLVLRTHETLLSQTGPNFPYTDGFLTGEPFPQPDDMLIANDVTAKRPMGSSYRTVAEIGPMSVQDPPNGIGRYVRTVDANMAWDSQLPDVAQWNGHVGTWRSARYPNITFEPHRSQFTQSTTDDVDELELGDYFSIDDTPAWLPPEDIEVLVQGYAEQIYNMTRAITFNVVPAGPYLVASRGTTFHRDGASSTLNSNASAGATSLSVATSSGPLWITGTVDFNIMIAGSLLHVTNISGASSPQTFTVDATRVNGVDKALIAGAEVHVHPLPIRGLAKEDMNLTVHDDVTGTFVTGNDFPPAVWVEQSETTGTFTSATFIEDTDPVGVVFTPSSTASFMVYIAGELDNSDATGVTLMSFNIRRGAVIGEGADLVVAADTTSILSLGTNAARISKGYLFDVTTTELPPGNPINITLAHRRATAGNASIIRRLLVVKPVRTQGGLPGSLIAAEPQAEDDVQDASDTSTSTSYTTTDMTTCGTAFVAPPSGKALIHVSSRIDHSIDAPAFVSYEVRQGNVVGSGTVTVAADDTRAITNQNVDQMMFGATFPISGLTAGADYNVRLLHRTTSGTLTLENRYVIVEQVA